MKYMLVPQSGGICFWVVDATILCVYGELGDKTPIQHVQTANTPLMLNPRHYLLIKKPRELAS